MEYITLCVTYVNVFQDIVIRPPELNILQGTVLLNERRRNFSGGHTRVGVVSEHLVVIF